MSVEDDLLVIAQRLDELSGDHELPELAELSDEIGKAVDRFPRPAEVKQDPLMEKIRELIDRAAFEKYHSGNHTFASAKDYPIYQQQYTPMPTQLAGFLKQANNVV